MIDHGHSLEHNPTPLSDALAADVITAIRIKNPTRGKRSATQKTGYKNGESRPHPTNVNLCEAAAIPEYMVIKYTYLV